ncbi:hypothetical protein QE381_000081 [Microbacterium sp. SORGH_AS 888]|nr:hypothetical protein [Microbacterium sp. SORGH_AS_0888]
MSSSSTPALADRRTRLESSSAVRAPESSSFGSMPMPRSTAFALPLRTKMAGRNTVVKATWNGITSFAVARGTASAKLLGTSSPMIIENTVAMPMPTNAASGTRTVAGSPHPSKTGPSRREIAGSIV